MQPVQILDLVTKYLLTLNTSLPIIFGTISTIAAIFKGLGGADVSLLDCADIIQANVDVNDKNIQDEIARLKAKLAANPT